jgi:hypothetical protein
VAIGAAGFAREKAIICGGLSRPGTWLWLAVYGAGECALGKKMNERFNWRVGEYRDQAAKLRVLAYETRFAESRSRLLMLADSFEKLAERVEARGNSFATAAD